MHSFHSKSLWSWQNSAISREKSCFGQLWRLAEGKQCKIGSFSLRYKLFKISFLTTFIQIKTLYNQIWNNCQICQILEFFEYGKCWRLLGGERCILEDWSWKTILFKMTFLITFISIIKLCNQIWQSILSVLVPTAKKIYLMNFILQNTDVINEVSSMFQYILYCTSCL